MGRGISRNIVALSASSWMNFLISRSCSHEVGKGGRGSEGGISRWDGNINTGFGAGRLVRTEDDGRMTGVHYE